MYPGQDLTEQCSYCNGSGKNPKFVLPDPSPSLVQISLLGLQADLWKANIESSDDALDVLNKYASASVDFVDHVTITPALVPDDHVAEAIRSWLSLAQNGKRGVVMQLELPNKRTVRIILTETHTPSEEVLPKS
jgi:hypothetical protein